MTVKHKGNQEYQGLAADTKPTNAAVNAQFYETDTGKLYRYNGTSWRPEYIKNPASMIVFKEGSTYYAQEADGTIVSSSSTDASIPIAYAINNIPGAAARGNTGGGRVFIFAADYECKTTITADVSTMTYNNVDIEGEGKATRIRFTPSSAITNGFFIKMSRPRLANMIIYGNSNVTNVVQCTGVPVASGRTDYGIIENCQIDGHPATMDVYGATLGLPVAGQRGIFMNAGDTVPMFWWHWRNLTFRGLGIGAYLFGHYVTSVMQTDITSINCYTAEKISGGQNELKGLWLQGDGLAGQWGIHLASEAEGAGSLTRISNLQSELKQTGTECAGLLIDPGVSNVMTSNIYNSYASSDATQWFSILDKSSPTPFNNHKDFDEKGLSRGRTRQGWWPCGSVGAANAYGILAGQIVESPATTFLTAVTANGPAKNFVTTSAIGNMSAIYYNHHDGIMARNTSRFSRINTPRLFCRFVPASTSGMRMFVGIWNQFAAPTSTADMLDSRAGVGLWLDTDVSPNWQTMCNDNTGTSTISQIGPGYPIAVTMYAVEVFVDHAHNKWGMFFWRAASPNTFDRMVFTTNIPDNTYQLGFLLSLEARVAGARTVQLDDVEFSYTV